MAPGATSEAPATELPPAVAPELPAPVVSPPEPAPVVDPVPDTGDEDLGDEPLGLGEVLFPPQPPAEATILSDGLPASPEPEPEIPNTPVPAVLSPDAQPPQDEPLADKAPVSTAPEPMPPVPESPAPPTPEPDPTITKLDPDLAASFLRTGDELSRFDGELQSLDDAIGDTQGRLDALKTRRAEVVERMRTLKARREEAKLTLAVQLATAGAVPGDLFWINETEVLDIQLVGGEVQAIHRKVRRF